MIPAQAVEAAAKRIGDAVTYRDVLAILEAAAPYMLEHVYTDGYCDGMSGDKHNLDKYRTTK